MAQTVKEMVDPVKVSPEFYSVAFENEHVRVLEIHVPPGRKTEMHSHPQYVIYSFGHSVVRFSTPEGKSQEFTMDSGEAAIRPAETHAAHNVGDSEVHVLNIELKTAGSAARRELAPDLPQVAPEYCQTILDSDRCRLLEIRLPAGASLPSHASPDQLIYPLVDGKVRLWHDDGSTQELSMRRGEPFFVRGMVCGVENIGNADAHVVKLDLMQ